MGKAGGRRPGSGRKAKAIEDNVKETIKAAIGDSDALLLVWKKVLTEAKNGSDRHINILFNYYYGKPKENQGEPTEMIINVLRNS